MKKNAYYRLYKQISSYFVVGGLAAIAEWSGFFLMNMVFSMDYMFATALSFVGATFVNWHIGKKMTFKDAASGMPVFKEIIYIYGISGMGLLFNLVLMYLLVGICGLQTMFAKVMATGFVFIWNFIARKLFVYRI